MTNRRRNRDRKRISEAVKGQTGFFLAVWHTGGAAVSKLEQELGFD